MFTIDPTITERDLKGKNLFKVLISMNNHQVATPETSLEEARSYVFIFREGRNRLSAYIGLHLLLTDRKLIYKHSASPFLEDELSEVEDEARDFAEYMGAMMDEVDFSGMSDLEQDSWIENQGIFSAKTPAEAMPAEQPPLPSAAAAAPDSQSPPVPAQPAPTVEVIDAPLSAAEPVKSLPKTYPAKGKEPPREDSEVETVAKDVQIQTPALEATKRRGETAENEATTGIEKPPKQTAKKRSYSATSVVSRDREALARLLTSF